RHQPHRHSEGAAPPARTARPCSASQRERCRCTEKPERSCMTGPCRPSHQWRDSLHRRDEASTFQRPPEAPHQRAFADRAGPYTPLSFSAAEGSSLEHLYYTNRLAVCTRLIETQAVVVFGRGGDTTLRGTCGSRRTRVEVA